MSKHSQNLINLVINDIGVPVEANCESNRQIFNSIVIQCCAVFTAPYTV